MKQWTDVDYTVTIKDADLTGATEIHVTIVQDGAVKVHSTDVAVVGVNAITGRLTERQTGKLLSSCKAEMFINWLDGAGRKAATKIPVTVEENWPREPLGADETVRSSEFGVRS